MSREEQAALRRVDELAASRARIVAAADEDRRRLHRDIHDGTQQRLVHAVIALKLARAAPDLGPAAAALVEEALINVERASSDLRDVVRGIFPSALAYGGLRTGLESLVADLAVRTDLRIETPRLPRAVETTAYLVVAEALTHAVDHARAERVHVDVRLDGDTLVVEIRDEGKGAEGAGTSLTRLLDRVDAAGGSVTVSSRRDGATTVRVELPVPPGRDGARQP